MKEHLFEVLKEQAIGLAKSTKNLARVAPPGGATRKYIDETIDQLKGLMDTYTRDVAPEVVEIIGIVASNAPNLIAYKGIFEQGRHERVIMLMMDQLTEMGVEKPEDLVGFQIKGFFRAQAYIAFGPSRCGKIPYANTEGV